MKGGLRNVFMVIGVLAIVVMLCTFDLSYTALWQNIPDAGGWFVAVVLIWIPIYLINAWSWAVLINDGEPGRVPFWRVVKYTITGYALNYVTPVGVLGGEPYRILELTPYVGASRAASSVILYAMMHIFSHFIFWGFSIVLYCCLYASYIDAPMGLFLLGVTAFCTLGIYFFMKGYRNGLAVRTLRLLARVPGLRKRIGNFLVTRAEDIKRVDEQIANLHRKRKRTFYLSLFLEFLARVIGCLEVAFILLILTDYVSFADCILIQAFTSLFANMFFFMPMEMGTREGGFAIAVAGLSLPAAFGVLAGLLTRVREVIWIVLGIGLMKVGNASKRTET